MSYVAVSGGDTAITAAHTKVASQLPALDNEALLIENVLTYQRFAVDRVMVEAGLYAPRRAARALLQSQGDVVEAAFLLRAFRATQTRWGESVPIARDSLRSARRISSAFKDLPGGQQLGVTYDYTHRLLGYFRAFSPADTPTSATAEPLQTQNDVMALLVQEELLEANPVFTPAHDDQDITQEPLSIPAQRTQRLQTLARADEGFLLGLAYSTQRGYGQNHPFLGELRCGMVEIEIQIPESSESICIGSVPMTECQMIHQFDGSTSADQKFTRGYGLVLGQSERKAMAMALMDRALRASELGEEVSAPAQDEEFVLSHGDTVAASGFVEHLKLPHHVDFQSELEVLRTIKQAAEIARGR